MCPQSSPGRVERGRAGAVTPCCQRLGPPNKEKSILGHFDKDSYEEIYFGEKYQKLRDAHSKNVFDKIDYCKDCDFLYDDPQVLVWSNDKNAKLNNMLGTGDDFILTEFNKSNYIN
jgi:radical SAM protein with 4Fe4S-binding SPASM domain